jgi:hypothetical protein
MEQVGNTVSRWPHWCAIERLYAPGGRWRR